MATKSFKKKHSPVEAFIALPDAEKERIWESYNREIPESETRPLTPAEAAEWRAIVRAAKARRRKAGRPRVGLGAQRVQVSVERGLLTRADAYARRNGLTRAQLVARGLEAVVGGKARAPKVKA